VPKICEKENSYLKMRNRWRIPKKNQTNRQNMKKNRHQEPMGSTDRRGKNQEEKEEKGNDYKNKRTSTTEEKCLNHFFRKPQTEMKKSDRHISVAVE
jgi:hypothetical protein